MVLQQLGGVNAIAYYAGAIFVSAGKLIHSINTLLSSCNDSH